MENVNWNFNAPNFVDFGANEHFCDDFDQFCNSAKKYSEHTFENDLLLNTENNSKQSPKELPKTPVGQNYFVQTPSRETYFVPTPSRVLRSSVKQQKITFNNTKISITNKHSKSVMNIKKNIKHIDSVVSSVPKKKFKLTLPQSPNFASKKLINKQKSTANKEVTHQSIHDENKISAQTQQIGYGDLSKNLKSHGMTTRSYLTKSSNKTNKVFKNLKKTLDPSVKAFGNPTSFKRKLKTESSILCTNTDTINPSKKFKLETSEALLKTAKTVPCLNASMKRKKRSTIPVPFKLSSAQPSKSKVVSEDKKENLFKARPVPRSMYIKPKSFKNNKALDITVPVSPAFASKHFLKRKLPHDDKCCSPKKSTVFKPRLTSSKTIPQPFSFDAKDKARRSRRFERIENNNEKEIKLLKFKARPAPKTSSVALPPKQVRKSTKVEPFLLQCDKRAESRAKESKMENKEVIESIENTDPLSKNSSQSNIKVLQRKPWKPKLERKRPTKPLAPVFLSQARIERREELRSKRNNIFENTVKSNLS